MTHRHPKSRVSLAVANGANILAENNSKNGDKQAMKATIRGPNSVLRQARHHLMQRGELPCGIIDPLVERSWRRSFQAGLEPVGRLTDTPHLTESELKRATNQHNELIAHAQPVMEYLHAQTRNSGSVVILSDENGVLLQVMGDPDFLTRAQRVALTTGATWHECYRGTNAIGTALAEAMPVVVHGAEHYLERNGFLTCAASPLIAPDGRLLGVLDISGEQRSRHPHTFSLVRAGAQMIENRLFDARHGNGIRLHFHPLAEGINTIAEGVIALSEDGWIVGANQAGLTLLGLVASDLGTLPLHRVLDLGMEDLLAWGVSRPGQMRLTNRIQGGRLFLRLEPGKQIVAVATRQIKETHNPSDAFTKLDTGDNAMHSAIERARKICGKPIPLLLQGESGVGKEWFAKAMHQSGPRRNKPFIAVNCAALPEHLIEAELFGYTPGAYTGARKEGYIGRIREADGGTLFLDEIGDMPIKLQTLLLRVLQERSVMPLGGGKPVSVDFSLISATHCDLKKDMEQGRFRSDLYYRINGLTLTIPPLRLRSDLNTLLTGIIDEEMPGKSIDVAPSLIKAMADYAWPGNLRQLKNAICTACAMLDEAEHQIEWQHLSDDLREDLCSNPHLKPADENFDINSLRIISDNAIRRTIESLEGNKTEAARQLGISRNTLYRRLNKAMG